MWSMFLMVVVLYIGAVLCVGSVGKDTQDLYPGTSDDKTFIVNEFNPKIYFGSVPEAMYSLFNLVLIAEFSQFGRPIFLKQPWFFPVFILIIFIATFGLMNMLIGLVVENTQKQADKFHKERKRARDTMRVQKMIKLVQLLDLDTSGFISLPELSRS